ncbi:hypothetical protein FHS21_001100 [Phyllobacterium trifolii]|jgi:hypothetical protein|uniref:Uncharacterized protein n=1 Tax=Phyllobacterium trifolii TaxID=300193 RepID=A0A839U923_9HYPH|nr:hypothetical protein [Phyllobacterium trifolii]MBB3144699.1 hypothetical protein [Phyllobacterium trifolii]
MAKGQQKSNREVRKPKKEKVAPKADVPFSSMIKKAEAPKAKSKG